MGMMGGSVSEEDELAFVAHDRDIQRRLFDAGFAGICVPVAYGGQGLSPAHQRAFNEELAGYEHASRVQVPTMTPCLAVLLDFGTEEQKQRHVPAILKGEEIWMQLLSEPSGGSDVAGALTSAVRDGDEWILNGSKVWTTGAWWSDWGLCLARTNWDVPKHRGLTVFILPLHQENVEIQQIELLNGSREFCQEFLTDVRVPDGDRIGEVDDGWTVGTRWMFHERMLHNSPLVTVPAGKGGGHGPHSAQTVLEVARDAGRLDDQRTRELIGEARTLELTLEHLRHRVGQGVITRQDARPVRGGRPPVPRHLARAHRHHRLRGGRRRRRGVGRRGRRGRPGRRHVPPAPVGLHRWRHHRDGAQRGQRAGPRHASGALRRP